MATAITRRFLVEEKTTALPTSFNTLLTSINVARAITKEQEKNHYGQYLLYFHSISNAIVQDEKLAYNVQKIRSFAKLQENWNFYGAKPFDQSLIDKAILIITFIDNQPQVFPTGRNSIQLEYKKTNGDYLEFEIFEDKIIRTLIKGEIEIESEITIQDIYTEIKNFDH